MKRLIIMSLFAAALPLWACSKDFDNSTVSEFDLSRYLGRWYEIARYDHSFERGMDYVQAKYTLQPNSFIRVLNQGVKNGETLRAEGIAKLKSHEKPLRGELLVSFSSLFYSDYRIIELAHDYSYAAVSGGRMNYFWLLAREPVMPAKQLKEILDRMKKLGFAVEKLEYPRQTPPETGAPTAK